MIAPCISRDDDNDLELELAMTPRVYHQFHVKYMSNVQTFYFDKSARASHGEAFDVMYVLSTARPILLLATFACIYNL